MKDKFTKFIESGGGWWCPKCQRGVEVTGGEAQIGNEVHGETHCSNCGLTLHTDTTKLPKIVSANP